MNTTNEIKLSLEFNRLSTIVGDTITSKIVSATTEDLMNVPKTGNVESELLNVVLEMRSING